MKVSKAGRRYTQKVKPMRAVTTRVPAEIDEAIIQAASEEGSSVSRFVERILTEKMIEMEKVKKPAYDLPMDVLSGET